MRTNIINQETPEERELNKKRLELAALEELLAERELELATLQFELRAFEAHYVCTVGTRYAELDEIEAQCAEAQASLDPDDQLAKQKAKQLRNQAQDTSCIVKASEQLDDQFCFKPSEKLKKLFYQVAKLIHPDYATDEQERVRRHKIMAEANRAYKEANEPMLEKILKEWPISPESFKGQGIGADLIRAIRRIAIVEDRLQLIEVEHTLLIASDLYQMKAKVEDAETKGRNLLGELIAQIDRQIAEARSQLASIQRKERI